MAEETTPHTEQFTIPRRPGWRLMGEISVSIQCDPLATLGVKLGLAARAAYQSGASLDGARLDGASLDGASLDGARLDGARLVGASLVGARLDGASLDGASLVGARLDGARLDGARLDGARLDGARLDGASLDGASLVGARLDGASLVGARLDGALVCGEAVTRLLACASRLQDPYVFYAFELQAGGVKIKAGCRWFTVAEYRAHVAATYGGTAKGRETSDILDFIEARCRAQDAPLDPPIEAEAA
jgi:hypothetical protein